VTNKANEGGALSACPAARPACTPPSSRGEPLAIRYAAKRLDPFRGLTSATFTSKDEGVEDDRNATLRKNLEGHLHEPLSPKGATPVAVRLPNDLIETLDEVRGDQSRSQYLRDLIARHLDESAGT